MTTMKKALIIISTLALATYPAVAAKPHHVNKRSVEKALIGDWCLDYGLGEGVNLRDYYQRKVEGEKCANKDITIILTIHPSFYSILVTGESETICYVSNVKTWVDDGVKVSRINANCKYENRTWKSQKTAYVNNNDLSLWNH